ncbi:MAG: hypothetical protein QF645_11705, partial [Planctomycetota bacterium]|nr:hypothetical protein [Planctomycetota bacterium]
RQETLRDFELQMEGLDSGAKELLRQQFPGVLGTVADFIEVDTEHLVAVEGALGDLAGAVVCDSIDSASRAISFVKEQKFGRTVVLARGVHSSIDAPQIELRGMIGLVSEFIRTDPKDQEWIHTLLASIVAVEEGSQAGDILASGLARSTMVTCDGDVYEPTGKITTGLKGGVGILSRKTELRALELEIEDYDRIIAEREVKRSGLEKEVETSQGRLEVLRHAVYDRNIDLHDANTRIDQLTARVGVLEGEQETAHMELREVDLQAGALEERFQKVTQLLEEIDSLKGSLAGEIAGFGMTLARYQDAREDLNRRLTESRVSFAKVEEQIGAIEKQSSMVETNQQESIENQNRINSLREETAGRIESVGGEILSRKEEERSLRTELETKKESLQGIDQARETQAERVGELRTDCESRGEILSGCETEIQNGRIREGESRVKLEGHVARVREEYEIDLERENQPEPEETFDWALLSREV